MEDRVKELASLCTCWFLIEHASLDNLFVHVELVPGGVENWRGHFYLLHIDFMIRNQDFYMIVLEYQAFLNQSAAFSASAQII